MTAALSSRPEPSLPWFFWAARLSFTFAGLLPWALPLARAALPLGPLYPLLDGVFFLICHRRPERTLVLAGTPMPLCSRCAGIALGLALGALVARPSPSLRTTRAAAAAAVLLMLTDVVTQDLGVHPVWHATRLATGFFLGYVLAIGLFAAIRREAAEAAA